MVAATRINSVFTPENVDGSIVQRENTDGGAPASSNGCPMVNIKTFEYLILCKVTIFSFRN